MNLIVKKARVIDPETNTDKVLDIVIKDGVISSLEEEAIVPEGFTVIEANGMTAFPGLCDIHVHFRDPGWPEKETIESGAQAALAGGVTTVVNMANTKPVVDNVETMKYIMDKADKLPITLLQNSAITKNLGSDEIVDCKAQLAAGACGFSDDGIPIVNVSTMIAAIEAVKAENKILSLHEELPQLLFSQGVNFGEVSKQVGVLGAPAIAESAIVERDLLLQKQYGGHLHFQHVSAARTVELIREAKANGQQVTCEVTPQHLTLTEDIVLEQGAIGRINPPIRTEQDRQALIEGIVDGTIDCIVTDHAPHTAEEKSKPIGQAPSGMIGIETSLIVAFNTLVRSGLIDRLKLAELMSVTPAELYGVKKGICAGMDADLCLFAEDEEFVYDKPVSRSTNSPFLGKKLTGCVKYTICKNQIHKVN